MGAELRPMGKSIEKPSDPKAARATSLPDLIAPPHVRQLYIFNSKLIVFC